MLQPIKINVYDKTNKLVPMELTVKDCEPFLFINEDEHVWMTIRDDELWFETENEKFKAPVIPGSTAKQQYEKFVQIIEIRQKALKNAVKYLEKEKELELVKNRLYKSAKES